MAYVDQNGLVLIDEIEATEDIKKLCSANDLLSETLEIINQILAVNSGFKGDTANAIEGSCAELIKRVNDQKASIEAEISFINQVVERYKFIDSSMKNQINSSFN